MLLSIVFAHVWGVLQLIVVASFARSASARTVLTAIPAGFFLCAPVALLLQLAWIHPTAWLTDYSVYNVQNLASYTIDPFIEEIVKVLPVVALLGIGTIRRQWSIIDCVLLGAAAGAGFGLAEDLYRYGAAADRARATGDGWTLATNFTFPFVPSVWTTLTSWLPPGAEASDSYFPGETGHPWVNHHLAWSAIGGLAVGLIWLRKGKLALWVGTGLFIFVGADHAVFNADAGSWVNYLLAMPFGALRDFLGFMPVAALAVAWWLDRQRLLGAGQLSAPMLAFEQSARPRVFGTLRAAMGRLPWSVPWVYGFARVRRAYKSALAAEPDQQQESLRFVVVDLRDRIDHALLQSFKLTPLMPPGWSWHALFTLLKRPVFIVWLVLLLPSFLWFMVGGWPQTTWVQTAIRTSAGWVIVATLSIGAQAWLLWGVWTGLRSWRGVVQYPIGDLAATHALRIACGVGAISFGGYALMRGLTSYSPSALLHVTDAIGSAPADGMTVLAGAAVAVPSDPAAAWREGYEVGRRGDMGMSRKDASPNVQAAYDEGYELGKRDASSSQEIGPELPPSQVNERTLHDDAREALLHYGASKAFKTLWKGEVTAILGVSGAPLWVAGKVLSLEDDSGGYYRRKEAMESSDSSEPKKEPPK